MLADLLLQRLARLETAAVVIQSRPGPGTEPAVGFLEGLKAVPGEKRRLRQLVAYVKRDRPDAVVLVSYSGFNLPLGEECRRAGVPVVYLAPPQVWAWGGFRTGRLKRAADKVVCLFPFEEHLLRQKGVDAVFLGYPLLDVVQTAEGKGGTLRILGFGSDERYVAFLPGSRPQETGFHRLLFSKVFRRLRELLPGLRGVVVTAPTASLLAGAGRRYGIVRHAECAVVVSGTATLETALLGTPQVVTYHLSAASRLVARGLASTRSFALPNILLGRGSVPEVLEPSVERLSAEVLALLGDPGRKDKALRDAVRLRQMLGSGDAIDRTAELLLESARVGTNKA